MADREKVEKGLRICTSKEPCNGCPYLNERNCSLSMVADALALLKEQDPVEPIYGLHGGKHCGNCRNSLWVSGQRFCASCGRAVKWEQEI